MNKVTVSATALGYNRPCYGQYGTALGPRTLKLLNTALQQRFPEATVTACGIDTRMRDYPGDAGYAQWDATFTTTDTCTEQRAQAVGEEIAALLFGQYGLGDSGALDDVEIEQVLVV